LLTLENRPPPGRRALFFAKELSIFEVSVECDIEVIIKAILVSDIANPE